MSYLKDNFLLTNKTAERLYFTYAKGMPIFDYHCHLPEKRILENQPFGDLCELWLSGDHYKWRLMRNYGIDERLITGDASNREKFNTYCTVLGTAFGNPLYHWSQLELKEYFNCETEICEANADRIWAECSEYLKEHPLTPQELIERSRVRCLFTTNDISDDLKVFEQISRRGYGFDVYPAFRADKVMNIGTDDYNAYVDKLGDIRTLDDLEEKITERLSLFIRAGARAADIALRTVYPVTDRKEAARIFAKQRAGKDLSGYEADTFRGYLTCFLMGLYAERNIVTELHVGAMRNNNSLMLNKLGMDTGFDSMEEGNGCRNMAALFDYLHTQGRLPKTIVFNLNPKMNEEMVTLIGCFQSAEARGKLQFGAAWWFLDNQKGIERHLETLSTMGHLGTFIGMLTDSRSFLSYPRHHYFRRILCNYLGRMMECGEMTSDEKFVGEVIKDICYRNAVAYFGGEYSDFCTGKASFQESKD